MDFGFIYPVSACFPNNIVDKLVQDAKCMACLNDCGSISPPCTIPEFSFQTKQLFDVIQQWPAVRGASEQYRRYVQKLR